MASFENDTSHTFHNLTKLPIGNTTNSATQTINEFANEETCVPPKHKSRYEEIIQLTVGGSTPIFVHKAILTEVPFFAKSLSNGMTETNTKSINLPEDDPVAFDVLLAYLHTSSISDSIWSDLLDMGIDDDKSDIRMTILLLHTYILADKYGMEEFKNMVADEIIAHHTVYTIDGDALSILPDDPLHFPIQTFLVKQLAWDLHIDLNDHSTDKEFLAWAQRGGGPVRTVVIELLALFRGPAKSPWEERRCTWHVHEMTPRCWCAKDDLVDDESGTIDEED